MSSQQQDSQTDHNRSYVSWDKRSSAALLRLLYEGIELGWRNNSGAIGRSTVDSKILPQINAKFGKEFQYKHYRNRLKWYKDRWNKYVNLRDHTSGFSYHEPTKMMQAGDEEWNTYLKAHPKDGCMQYEPLEDYEFLRVVVGNQTSTGSHMAGLHSGGSDVVRSKGKRRGGPPSHSHDDVSHSLGANTSDFDAGAYDGDEDDMTLAPDDTESQGEMGSEPPLIYNDLLYTNDVDELQTSQATSRSYKKRRGETSGTSSDASSSLTTQMRAMNVTFGNMEGYIFTSIVAKAEEREEKAIERRARMTTRVEKARGRCLGE